MLDFENQLFLDIFHEDGLLIMSRGLGVNHIFTEFLKVCSDPGSLVLVLNTTSSDEEYFIEQIHKQGVSHPPKVITNEINANVRQSTYIEGGVLFITSRILVVDLLTDRVPINHVTGICVYRAHKVIESCQEAFILRLFRQKNKTGFIKAFTDTPESFTSGFCHVERIMKNLFVKHLFLWPRFHASVVSCFNKHKVSVVEIHCQMTPAMTSCQSFLLDIINACINELKKSTSSIDTDEITVENALSKCFELIIQIQLEPIWHQLSARTRQLVSDLKTLRLLLRHLVQYDCVTFYSLVQSIRTSERAFGQNTGWLFLESADSLFVHAKERVYGNTKLGEMKSSKEKEVNPEEEEEINQMEEEELTASLEPCPKWKALSDILEEIALEEEAWEKEKNECEDDMVTCGRILVCAEDDRTCNQLKGYLCEGGEQLLSQLFKKYVDLKKGYRHRKDDNLGKISKKDAGNGRDKLDPDTLTLTQMARGSKGPTTSTEVSTEKEQGKAPGITCFRDTYYGIVGSPTLVIHPLHGCNDPHSLARTLEEIQPKYVVLYDPDMGLVRQLEVFKASRPGRPLRVYFMIYKGSVEEQRYLTTLRNEKEAFEYLIREKATMVITEDQDGKSSDNPNLARGMEEPVQVGSSRKGGQLEINITPKVIVDMREFRSELPSLIHRRGIEIEPVTIEVGDYILTPDICVERKSVSDLIGSLNNGRLYEQALSMCRFYKKPILLIEFDANKSFSLQAKSTLNGDVSLQDVTSKLSLLTIHFPKLRLLWCPSPYATAQLFQELKAGKPQPTAGQALSVMSATPEIPDWSDRYNHGPQDFVLRMPGINSKNFHLILKNFKNLHQVSQATLEELTEALGSSINANQLHAFLHKQHDEESHSYGMKDKNRPKVKADSKGKSWSKRGGKCYDNSRGRGVKRKP